MKKQDEMNNQDDRWPLDSQEHLEEALREQGELSEESSRMAPILLQLRAWRAPVPTTEETQDLLVRLSRHLPAVSIVRASIARRNTSPWARLQDFIEIAHIQVSILQARFWVISSLVTLLGMSALFASDDEVLLTLILRALGPLLAYLGTSEFFRDRRVGMLEFEMSCPPTPQQLTLARLLVILCYNMALGLLLSLLLWTHVGGNILLLTSHWLMPMLLVTGMGLTLSLFIASGLATMLAYVTWLIFLGAITSTHFQSQIEVLSQYEAVMGLAGIALIVIAQLILSSSLIRTLTDSNTRL
ncbi:MAG TPA: hypothetical protein VKR06_05490 [Ktedonosporobacter sp.]|nr:hypothetical protein [Ktedonosporobacter sp.]